MLKSGIFALKSTIDEGQWQHIGLFDVDHIDELISKEIKGNLVSCYHSLFPTPDNHANYTFVYGDGQIESIDDPVTMVCTSYLYDKPIIIRGTCIICAGYDEFGLSLLNEDEIREIAEYSSTDRDEYMKLIGSINEFSLEQRI